MIEMKSITDQNFVCDDNLNVTTMMTVVNLSKNDSYMVRLTSHMSLEYPERLIDDVPSI